MAHAGCQRGRVRFQFQELRNQNHRNRLLRVSVRTGRHHV